MYQNRKDAQIRNNRRKQQNCRRRFIMRSFSLLLTLTILLSVSVLLTNAKSGKAEENSFKYYTSIPIMPGDTLTGIADKYCDENFKSPQAYMEEVQIVNSMEDDTLTAGMNLVIPYYSQEFK